jgi:hypothetical protein
LPPAVERSIISRRFFFFLQEMEKEGRRVIIVGKGSFFFGASCWSLR